MSIPRFAAAFLLMSVATIGRAQTPPADHAAHHSPEQPQPATPGTAIPAGKMMESKDGIASLRGLIERAERAKTVAEREHLLDEHLAAMRLQLNSLQSQQCAMDKEPADGAKPGMMDGGMKKDHMMMCHKMMKARMDTMQELLEQTWRREELRKKGAK